MASPLSNLQKTASESQKNVVLVICILAMSVMCIGLIWQAQVIANQREDIKWLQDLKFGGQVTPNRPPAPAHVPALG